MIFHQLKEIKRDIEKTNHYIRRLEKDVEDDHKIEFYRTKLKLLENAASRLEDQIKNR